MIKYMGIVLDGHNSSDELSLSIEVREGKDIHEGARMARNILMEWGGMRGSSVRVVDLPRGKNSFIEIRSKLFTTDEEGVTLCKKFLTLFKDRGFKECSLDIFSDKFDFFNFHNIDLKDIDGCVTALDKKNDNNHRNHDYKHYFDKRSESADEETNI